jgi:hypothetical protein
MGDGTYAAKRQLDHSLVCRLRDSGPLLARRAVREVTA